MLLKALFVAGVLASTAAVSPAPPAMAASTSSHGRAVLMPAQRCSSNLADELKTTGKARQLVVVEAPTYRSIWATVTLWQRSGSCWAERFLPWRAHIGAAGFSDHHVEGDNSTPTGDFGIGPVMYGNAPNPGVRYRYRRLACGDWWDEDPTSRAYNTFRVVPCGATPPFGGGSEALWKETAAYPSFAVVEYNSSPVRPGAGSGIFIHADTGTPTAGCVSVPLQELDQLLRWLDPKSHPLVVLGPKSEITRF